MERHGLGALENMEASCGLQSRTLLERLGEVGAPKEAFAARRCEGKQDSASGARRPFPRTIEKPT